MSATDAQDLIERYIGVWNEPDPGIRLKTVRDLWTEDGVHLLRPPAGDARPGRVPRLRHGRAGGPGP
ncbi:hypothetical protein ACWD4F_20720 [Streptomyces aureus]